MQGPAPRKAWSPATDQKWAQGEQCFPFCVLGLAQAQVMSPTELSRLASYYILPHRRGLGIQLQWEGRGEQGAPDRLLQVSKLAKHNFNITVFINKMPSNWSKVQPLIVQIIWRIKKKITVEISLGKILLFSLVSILRTFLWLCLSSILSSGPGTAVFLILEYK